MTVWRAMCDVYPQEQTAPGTTVQLQTYVDLAPVTAPLDEKVDIEPTVLPNTSTVDVLLQEWGNASMLTRKLRVFSLSDVTAAAGDILAYNLVDSLDRLVMAIASAGTNVIFENGGNLVLTGGSTGAITAADEMQSRDLRAAVGLLRKRSAIPRTEELFTAIISPGQSFSLRSKSDPASWRPPHEYSSAQNIWAGAVGVYEGCYVIETPRITTAQNGAGTPAAFTTKAVVMGKQALARAVAEEPHTLVGPVTDVLRRQFKIGWYAIEGWARFREACIQRVETADPLAGVA